MNITVELEHRSYDVVLGNGVRHGLGELIRSTAPRAESVAIVTSPSLRAQEWFDVASGLNEHVIEVPDGENAKNFATLARVCDELSSRKLSRHDVVVAVGGGAVTDLAGFAAAVYLRGLGVVHVPTSLVGQVDAAIGGKTAINLATGKNLVGAFHQPLGVLCDFETLVTLPERDRLGGLGEVAKCWLLEERRAHDLEDTPLSELVTLSVGLKAAIVSADEHENGPRALLNYGHTLGHALEILALARGHDELRHGEAVAIGLAFAVRLAHALGRVSAEEIVNHDEVLANLGLSGRIPEFCATSDIVEAMSHDKKAHHDLAFVLPGPDGFEVVRDVPREVIVQEIEQFRGI